MHKIHPHIQCMQKNGTFFTFGPLAISLLVNWTQNPYTFLVRIWEFFYILFDFAVANDDPNAYDFGKYWEKYWTQRIQVYYDKDRRKITEDIGANYQCTVFSTDESSNDEMQKDSRPASSISSNSDVLNFTHARFRKAPSYGNMWFYFSFPLKKKIQIER